MATITSRIRSRRSASPSEADASSHSSALVVLFGERAEYLGELAARRELGEETGPGRADQPVEKRRNGLSRQGADELVDHLPATKCLDGRNAADPVPSASAGIRIDVNLDESELVPMLLGAAFENRGERLAWSAPVSPEIDDDRKVVERSTTSASNVCSLTSIRSSRRPRRRLGQSTYRKRPSNRPVG